MCLAAKKAKGNEWTELFAAFAANNAVVAERLGRETRPMIDRGRWLGGGGY